jgi:Ca-activated chloride channel homolog
MTQAWRFKILGYPVGLAQPHLAALILVALALLVVGLTVAWRRRERLRSLIPDRFAERLAPGVSRTFPVLQASFATGALFLWALALTQPQCGSRSELTKKRGVDVVVALDASKSMLARDVVPSRLDRAKLELLTLLDELKGDRIGIVAFAGDAYVQCPLTSDYEAAKMFLRAIDPNQMQQGGTDIGGALRLSKEVLDAADRGGSTDRVVVLISDGEDLEGSAVSIASQLGEAGIHIYAVAIGSESGEPIPELDRRGEISGYKKDASGNTILTRLDKRGLERLAESSNGELFYRPGGVAMSEVVSRIDRLQKSELESRVTVRYDERFQLFALPGLLLYLAALALPSARRAARNA